MEKTSNISIVFIGIIAILALIIGWSAFNRSGEDLLPTVARETEEAYEEAEDATIRAAAEIEAGAEEAYDEAALVAARAEARAELAAIEARIEAEEAYDEAAAEIAAVRQDLAVAYENASAEARAELAEIDAELEAAEDSVRNGTGNVLELIAGAFLLLEADVRVETAEEEM